MDECLTPEEKTKILETTKRKVLDVVIEAILPQTQKMVDGLNEVPAALKPYALAVSVIYATQGEIFEQLGISAEQLILDKIEEHNRKAAA